MEDEQDNRGPAIIVIGGLVAGFSFYGPFDSIDSAVAAYAESMYGIIKQPVTIALLQPLTASPASNSTTGE